MHSSLRIRTYLSILASLLLISLSITSCADTGTTSSSNSMTLKVGSIVDAIPFFPFYVAIHEKYFQSQGLTLDPAKPIQMGNGSKLATAVESGSVDVGVGTVTDAFTVSRIDSYIRMIGSISNDFLLDIVVTKQFEQQANLTSASSLADKVKALAGKKIGITAPGSSSDALVTYLFKQQGLDPVRGLTKVNIGGVTTTDLAALQAGKVDAVVVGAPGGEIAETQGFGDTFISPTRGDIAAMQGQLFGVAYAKQETIDAKPKAIQAFIRGLSQADTFIQTNPNGALALLITYLKLSPAAANAAWTATKQSMPSTPQISQATYDVANQFQVSAGFLAVQLPYKDLVATGTINSALSGMPKSS